MNAIPVSSWHIERGARLTTTASSVRTLLSQTPRHDSSALAVSDATRNLTWAALRRESDQIHKALAGAGIAEGQRVVCALPPSVNFVVLLAAVLRLGATLVPIHPATRSDEVHSLATEVEAMLIVSDEADHAVSAADAIPTAAYSTLKAGGLSTRLSRRRQAKEVAFVIFTSGTTSAPKGVVCDDSQVSYALGAIQSVVKYTGNDVVLSRLPVSFDYGLYQVLLAMLSGAQVVFLPEGHDARAATIIDRHRVTILPIVPSMVEMLALSAGRASPDLSSVRLVTSTGERLAVKRQETLYSLFPNACIAAMYGVTECKRVSIEILARGVVGDHSGFPLPGTRVAIVDADLGSVPRGSSGEIVVIGHTVTAGYWGGSAHGSMRFARTRSGDRLLFTGDHGFFDRDGRLHVIGRDDGLVKVRGIRVSAARVEEAAMAIEGVQLAVLLQHAQQEATLWVETSQSPAIIRQDLLRRLPSTHVPRAVRCVAAFPLTANGKVDRNALVGEEE